VRYFTKVLGQPISPADAYAKATPAQRATWFPEGPPAAGYGAGPTGVDLVDGAPLAAAKAAGERALREGYGQGPTPCGTCAGCTYGGPCRRPLSKAMARLRAGQAEAARVDQAEADLAELQRIAFQWEVRHRRLL
jgi:hypothetical protein